MNETDVNDIARQLVQARQSGALKDTVETATINTGPSTISDAYQIQQAVVMLTGAVGGWKTGAENAQAVPIAAPVFADNIYPSGTTLQPGTMRLIGLEAELGFRLARDLPATGAPYRQSEVVAAVDCMLPLIELVDSRLRDHEAAGDLWKLADNQINSGFVLGQPIGDWQQVDLDAVRVVLRADKSLIADKTGWNYDGSPIELVVRFVNEFVNHCGGVCAGQIVTTGSMTGIDFIDSTATVTADFSGLGVVSVTIA